MTNLDKQVIIAMADNRMNITDAANALSYHRNSVIYHIKKVKEETGLDARDFHDLCKLFVMIFGKEMNDGADRC